jgi:hypothetical protein
MSSADALNSIATAASAMRSDAEAAMRFVIDLANGEIKNRIFPSLIRTLARKDPNKAITLLDQIPAAGIQNDALKEMGSAWAESDPKAAIDWANQQDWGSPAKCRVRVMPALIEFIGKCAERGIGVALSTWFREDATGQRFLVPTARRHGEIWRRTLELIEGAGLLDQILYVDLCNEWPLKVWAPFFNNGKAGEDAWSAEASTAWMRESIALLKEAYSRMDFCFSFTTDLENWQGKDVSFLDLLEPHIWMVQKGDFFQNPTP